ncbi:MAG: NAD(P)-dependent alcohol dehydrogenase [Mitsuaria chitosanitabida]|uniref:NAD(P)-dependent alcohol dehydrogenase n=1 Tax=Roseateles chitosanitabidus TaxID=65048 RepID=UPI001B13CC1E|nr:NAD(P)-dependent alcohol dehydrogenase [Roseateles chitosanitabidus]MBO9687567.1 NAD(P)-dependent alcohol dehydrogenase [Roseateles chitosanitabidus]
MRIRAAIARRGQNRFAIEDCVMDPVPRRREARLRMLACGLCHTDLAARDQHLRTPLPAVLGHEGVGVIEALGPETEGLRVGQRVLASFGACGECPSCASSAPAYCRHLARLCLLGQRLDGSSPLSQDGAPLTGHFFGQSSFATHAIVATANLVPLGEDLPAALMAPLACGVQTGMSAMVNVLRAGPGDAVAIFGCGGVGLAAVIAARIAGCERILAVDLHEERLALARSLGATAVARARRDIDAGGHAIARGSADSRDAGAGIDAALSIATDWGGLTHALDTTGQPAVIETAFLKLLRPRGTLVCAGVGKPDAVLTLPHNLVMLSGKTLRGTIEGDADPRTFVPRMVGWYREGRLPLERIVRTYPFEAIDEAVADMVSGRVVKPVLVFEQE